MDARCVCQVAKLFFFIMGFRGDWKAMRQIFSLCRHYNTNQERVIENNGSSGQLVLYLHIYIHQYLTAGMLTGLFFHFWGASFEQIKKMIYIYS